MKPIHPLSTALLASLIAVAGCSDANDKTATPATATTPAVAVSIPAIATEAKGFTVGSAMSVRTVYVFFDAQCPHCAVLWEQAKPLKAQAKFVWIPVGFSATSASQGAALLAAADPAAAMDMHEASMKDHTGGISASGNLDAQKAAVESNTKLLTRLQFPGVPTIVAKHAVTGELVIKEGAMPTAALANALGLVPPPGS